MNNIGDAIVNTTTSPNNKVFDPTYLNLEYIFQKILNFFRSPEISNTANNSNTSSNGSVIRMILFILAFFFILIIVYSLVRILEIRAKEKKHLEHEFKEYAHKQKEREEHLANPGGAMNQKWQNVLTHVFSENSADWRLAVLEADIMLEDLMDELGFKGENLGEKLKSTDQEKFKNLTNAWEVHIIRNKIAHEGADFELSQREAKRVISIYEQIFNEYGFI